MHITGGTASRGHFEYRCARSLAAQIGAPFHELAGGHNPLVSFPRACAERIPALRSVLVS